MYLDERHAEDTHEELGEEYEEEEGDDKEQVVVEYLNNDEDGEECECG